MSKKPIRHIFNNDEELYYDEYQIKKKSGKIRKIIAPSKKLKHYSRRAMHKLNWQFNKLADKFNLSSIFHGFIPNRNSVTAAQYHIGFEHTRMWDITNFFDNVKLDMFDEYMFEQLDLDPTLLFHRQRYAAQGFPSSPSLANIAIIPVIKQINTNLNIQYQGNYALTIYADDIQISINDTDPASKLVLDSIVTSAFEYHGFEINKSKTRSKFAKYGWRRILGINVGPDSVRATRATMNRLRAIKHKAKIKEPREVGNYGQVVGGLTTWSKCQLPRKYQA